ncbi:MAG: PolC-type DNA polymerase III [Ignavibacteriales bacterium]
MQLHTLCERLGFSAPNELKDALITEVKVLMRSNTWKMDLLVTEPVSPDKIQIVAEQIKARIDGLEAVRIQVTAEDPDLCLQKIINDNWEHIKIHIDHLYPDLLSGAAVEQTNDRITILFPDKTIWKRAIESNVSGAIESWIYEQFHMKYVVSVLHKTNPKTDTPVGLKNVSADNVVPSEGIAKKRTNDYKTKNGKTRNLPIMPICELQEGLREVAIQGEIVKKDSRELKNGRKLVIYDVTDYSDTVGVKIFDEDPMELGDWVKASGEFHYDKIDKDVVFFADRIEKADAPQRIDSSAEKRVELHLHTMMSTLDAVTDIGQLMKRAASFGHTCLAITDHGSIQAFPEAHDKGEKHNIKVIYGVEGYLVDDHKQDRSFHVILLAANQTGIKNLYNLVSGSYIEHFYRTPRILRSALAANREGLIVGSACERGEVIRAYLENLSAEEQLRIAEFYDYLEIQPTGNNMFLVREGVMKTEEGLQEMNRAVVSLGKEIGKPVVATGDVHFLDPHHEVFRRILLSGKDFKDAESQTPLYYRTTEEMLAEFQYLGEDTAYEVVVTNTNLIADRCEKLRPVPDGHFSPKIEGATERLTSLSWERAREIYKEPLPAIVEARIKRELDSITTHGFSELYMVAHDLVKKSNSDGYLVGSRGSVGSSFAAFLIGITEVNPLAPHYRCECGYNTFFEDGTILCGADLPVADCPQCRKALARDGFDIPFETFLGFEGDKVPDIDLNFSGDYQSKAHQFVEEMFGKENVFRAGTIATVARQTAYGFVKNYEEKTSTRFRNAEIERLIKGIVGVKRTTGQHPGGLMVVPREMNITEFTPVQRPAEDVKSEIITTHFDYHALGGVLVKLDILGHDDPTVIRSLEDLTGYNATTIPLDEPKTMQLFSSVESLGVKPEDIRTQVGTYGIPEFNTRFVRQMLEITRPKTFAELVRISGLSHGTNVWLNNAHDLIKDEIATLNDVIATRDDIMIYLILKGLEKKESFKIMENVRKGKGLKPDEAARMAENSVPDWYIRSCQKIEYMFPKAHAVAYVMMAYRIAYFKVYYPLAFYASFFSVRATDFDEVIVNGYDEVRRRLEEIEKMGQKAPPKEKSLIPVLEVALEMLVRGFKFYPVNIYLSDAVKFQISGDGLLLPFSALPGVGATAARNLAESSTGGIYTSVEDLQRRSRVNKTVIEILERNGCLKDLPPGDQVSLFG